MALNADKQLDALATVAEALRLTWALKVPYAVLTVLMTLPWSLFAALGAFDSLSAFQAASADSGLDEINAEFPLGDAVLLAFFSFVLLTLFSIFWYRYLLLGPRRALKFGLPDLNRMFWRFTGCGLAVMSLALTLVMMATLTACLLWSVAAQSGGQAAHPVAYLLIFAFCAISYGIALNFAARSSLVFPATAVSQALPVAASWALSRDSAGNLLWALLIGCVPLGALALAVNSVFYGALGVDITAPQSAGAGAYWLVELAISPVSNLSLAVALAIVAVAYRDLTGRLRAAASAGGDARLVR